MVDKNPWRVDDIVASTGLPPYAIRKFVRGGELLTAAKRMVRTEKRVPYYYRSAAKLLYAIALEAGLKALWEIDDNERRQAPHTHDLSSIFAGLRPERREKHRRWYGLIAGNAGSSVSLDAALKANADMVRDFKYGDYDGETGGVVGAEVVRTLIHITLLAYKAQPDAIGLIRNTFHGEMELQAVTLMMLKLAI